MSNDYATAKAFRNWEELVATDLGKTTSAVVEDAVKHGDVAAADPKDPALSPAPKGPAARRSVP